MTNENLPDSYQGELALYLKCLDKKTRDSLADVFTHVLESNDSDLAPTQVRDIEPVKHWLRTKYYNVIAPSLYDFWEEEITDFCEGRYNEWVITGSIGTGKSTAALVCALRKLYELSCFDYPQRLFRLADMTKIFFAYLSVNIKQAELTGFGQIREQIDQTRYFQEHFERQEGIDSVLRFPKGVFFIPGSDQISFIGTNLFGCILDEMNFLRTKGGTIGDVSKAQSIYQEATDRRRSRFMSRGRDPGFSLLVSSSSVQTSFTSSRIRNAGSGTKVTISKLWEVKPKGTYSEKRFYVFNGSEKEDAFVVERPHDLEDLIDCPLERGHVSHTRAGLEEAQMPLSEQIAGVVEVLPATLKPAISAIPIDFRESFQTDLYAALKNIAGVSIAPMGKLFTSRALWNRAVQEELKSPFRKETFELTLKGVDSLAGYFNTAVMFKEDEPRRHPWARRYLRVDQSKNTDCTGIACVHVAGWDETPGIRLPVVEVDFVLKIQPPPKPDKIGFHKVRAFIIMLRDLGLPISRVTFDQYQSEDHQQLLELAGITTGYMSVDRDDRAYTGMVNLLNEGRLHMYDYPPLRTEIFNLEHDRAKAKVDHPKVNSDGSKGSKDAADALVGALLDCVSGVDTAGANRKEGLKQILPVGPTMGRRYEGGLDFSWVVPPKYRGKKGAEVEVVKVGSSLGTGPGYEHDGDDY